MLRPTRRAASLLPGTAGPTLDRFGPVVGVRPQPGTLPLPEVSGVGVVVVESDDDPEVVPPLPSGVPVGAG